LAEWILQFAVSFAFCTQREGCDNFCKIEFAALFGKSRVRRASGNLRAMALDLHGDCLMCLPKKLFIAGTFLSSAALLLGGCATSVTTNPARSAKHQYGDTIKVDVLLQNADSDDYDALLLPGGVMNPDQLRQVPEAVEFVRAFFEAGKPVAAICHGPQMLIEADVVRGRKLTSYPSLKTDLINAGAEWVDEKVVVDQGLVTSRKPDDIPDFNKKMIKEFAEGIHIGQTA
jgi:protease I